ncbi:hypothetical protein NDU88_009739 [Pleurodeles waltl]|uniref:Uncharacterized protein n=1 Tax=Pleurodeles waltl TaxID=8319 RepID=A0AAV7S1W3_PLEWA|nr:hypothetical protein NDU88_009739 [Pleurodeles waltl]
MAHDAGETPDGLAGRQGKQSSPQHRASAPAGALTHPAPPLLESASPPPHRSAARHLLRPSTPVRLGATSPGDSVIQAPLAEEAAADVLGLGTRSRTPASHRRHASGGQDRCSSQGSEGRPAPDDAASPQGAASPGHTGRLGRSFPGRVSESQTRPLHLSPGPTSPDKDARPIKDITPGRNSGCHVTAGSGPVYRRPPGPGGSRSSGQSGSQPDLGSPGYSLR